MKYNERIVLLEVELGELGDMVFHFGHAGQGDLVEEGARALRFANADVSALSNSLPRTNTNCVRFLKRRAKKSMCALWRMTMTPLVLSA